MFVRALPILLALLALLALSAEARPWRGTLQSRRLTPEERSLPNSERLARGLPPRAPIVKRFLPGHEPTLTKRGTHSASASPSPSPSPSAGAVSFSGRIEVKETKEVIGFVANAALGVGFVDLTSNGTLDLEVKLSTTSDKPVSILATNAIFPGPQFIGGAGNTTLKKSSPGYANITNVPQTKPGALPTESGVSAIWKINKRTKQLTAHWINEDGSKPDTTIAYVPEDNYLFLTGDLDAWEAAANASAKAVELFLVK